MKVLENTDDRLVIEDTHEDKKIALKIAIVVLSGMVIYMLYSGDGSIALLPGGLAVAALIALLLTKGGNTLTLDKAQNQISFVMDDGKELSQFQRPFTDLVSAFVSEKEPTGRGHGGTVKCPVLVFRNDEQFKLRKHHTAGSQSREMVDVITGFLERS